MHWTPHSSLGAATIAFYSPALVASACLLYLHGSPRMTWFFLTLMSAIRIASGVLVILYESGEPYYTDLATSASIMLGIGLFPLLFALVGWFYIVDTIDPSQTRKLLHWPLAGIRVIGVVALATIIAGSILLGPLDKEASGIRAGAALVKAGAILVVAILGACIGILVMLWVDLVRRKLRSKVLLLILSMLSLSAILLILRVVYTCLVIFKGGPHSIWNPLNGSSSSLDVLVRMSLLPEYVIVVVMVLTGFWMLRWRKSGMSGGDEVELSGGKLGLSCVG